jgi:catechol-2,3-dioxygenase
MAPIARLAAVSLDCSDPKALAAFYQALLDLDTLFESDEFVALKGAGILMTMQRVDDHQMPSWPDAAVPKQIHLELAVDDLDAAEVAAQAIGARKAELQPSPEVWRVLIDPAGHPFCVTTLVPEV